VFTIRGQFADGMYAEAGATNVFDVHQWTIKYAKLLGVELDPVTPPTGASCLHVRGKRIVMKPNTPVDWPFELRADEQGQTRGQLWTKYVCPALKEIGDPGSADWPSIFTEEIGCNDIRAVSEGSRRVARSISILRLGLADQLGEGADAYPRSISCVKRRRARLEKQLYVIRGGSDTLPRAFAAKLSDKIHYGCAVVRVEHDKNARG
jgi:monoamine oxidase